MGSMWNPSHVQAGVRILLGAPASVYDGEEMAKRQTTITRAEVKLWAVLAAVAIAGVAISAAAEWYLSPGILRTLAKELGVAAATAGILGLTVDIFLKREFAKDVFKAAFSYILPEALKEEAARIVGYQFLCTRHKMIVDIDEIEDARFFKATVRIERTIENVTRHTQNHGNGIALDDWGPERRAEITRCSLKTESGQLIESGPQEKNGQAVERKTKEVPVRSGGSITVVSEGYEIRHRNDELLMNFKSPTIDPEIEIRRIPAGIKHDCSFGVPGEIIRKSNVDSSYILEGTQFPGQHMRVRFWPEQDES